MTTVGARRVACGAAILWTLGSASWLRAQTSIGTWVKQPTTATARPLTMTVEACCGGGRRLTYRIASGIVVMTVESPFDGTDVPVIVAGKPNGETMAIKRLNDHQTFTVIKMNGKPFGTSKATLSPDDKTMTVESEYTTDAGGVKAGKHTDIWVRK
jgi:hypothetical protein